MPANFFSRAWPAPTIHSLPRAIFFANDQLILRPVWRSLHRLSVMPTCRRVYSIVIVHALRHIFEIEVEQNLLREENVKGFAVAGLTLKRY